MRRLIGLMLAAVGLALGVTVATGLDRPAAAQPTPVDVVLGTYIFEPAELIVPVGVVTLNLTNVDSRRHNMIIDFGNGVEGESDTFSAGSGGIWEVAFDQPGAYPFYCSIDNHAERGMVGTLIAQ
ncbi:MAG: cupredoxin domain-containing protein [Chloroflexi bacterium]|nr:cupredoxin domain-containing protein [Chloroflexota bacterium]